MSKDFFYTLMRSIVVGLALAFVIVLFNPSLLYGLRPVVNITQPLVTKPATVSPNTPLSYADAVERASPAVVNIYTEKLLRPNEFSSWFKHLPEPAVPQRTNSLGSGVIFSAQGYLLTNHHLIENAREISVQLADGERLPATIVGSDPETDLAVLKIKAASIALPTIVLGTSDHLRVGDVVLAIGNPFGLGQTVTMGIVSATGRNQLGINTFENFIQTDAAINPGNSGGALINATGELIGINTAIFSRSGGSQGIGFAIPTLLAQSVLSQIIEHGHPIRGWLGVQIQDLTPELAQAFQLPDQQGAVIVATLEKSPAAAAGLMPGDVIMTVGGIKISNATLFLNLVAQQKPGQALQMVYLHEGKPQEISVTVGQRPLVKMP